jgi:hypothetical protein
MTLEQLKARASLAGEWYREGRITRAECFRLEMDASLGNDTGPINWLPNREYEELLAEGVEH